MRNRLVLASIVVASTSVATFADEPLVVKATRTTAPLASYEDAPATPDADDPAIWINRRHPKQSLVIGTAKDAGLLVYDLNGTLVQALLPPSAPHVSTADPPTPAGPNASPDRPCIDSDEGETFGRYNNVDIAYDIRLGTHPRSAGVDVAVVSDRGCDRVRFFKIDPSKPGGPLVDITSPDAPRVFATRYDQPSPLQPSGVTKGWHANPVDDQNTVYGLTVAQGKHDEVFVSQRERGLVRQLRIRPAGNWTLTYELERTFLFDTSFHLPDGEGGTYAWTPCREAASEEPQSEGLMVDRVNNTLYVAFETIGLYKLPLGPSLPSLVTVRANKLIERVKSFGQPYLATLDEDEFECAYNPEDPTGDIVASGSNLHVGRFIQADLEGLSLVTSVPGHTLMLASSQGDSSFHFYWVHDRHARHLGSFLVEGVGETDGVHYVPVSLGAQYPLGLLVVQNGQAAEPSDTSPINGYELDGATQFLYVNFLSTLEALKP